jgi:hypothetical protein
MVQPCGLVTPGTEHLTCQVHLVLYGFKLSPRVLSTLEWILPCSKLASLIVRPIPISTTNQTTNLIIILILYVDDLLIGGNDEQGIAQLKSQLMAQS